MIKNVVDGSPVESLSRWSKKKVLCACDFCGETWQTDFFHVAEKHQTFCFSCTMKKAKSTSSYVFSEKHKQSISSAIKKSHQRKAKQPSPLKGRNAWDSNQRQKIGEIVKAQWASGKRTARKLTDEEKLQISKRMQGNTHFSGSGGGGFCKWFEIQNNGKSEKVQGTWELAYAKYLIEQNTPFQAHPPSVFYADSQGKQRRYFPDFLRLDTGEYMDVKNPFCLKQDAEKLERIKASGIQLKVITKEVLIDLQIL